jgi:hypothetical protein
LIHSTGLSATSIGSSPWMPVGDSCDLSINVFPFHSA